jgi:hypothetical protein
MHSKKCTNCGNDNDPLLTNCLFCKSPLPIIDLNSIPNEVLVMNAAEWIGKMKEGWYNAKAPNARPRMVLKGEIQGNALRYLSLLEIRATTNTNLVNTINNLRSDYTKYEKTIPSNQKIAIGIVIFFIIYCLTLYLNGKH